MKTPLPEARASRRACAFVLLAATVAPAWALDLPEVMQLLGHRTHGEARFTEQRYVHGLDEPLTSTGTLSFSAPDRFERRTLTPRPESLRVEGNQVTMSRGGRSRTLALDASPEAQVAVEAVRGTLTGNAAVLQKYFKVRVDGTTEQWTLDLVPLDGASAGPLLEVHMTGRRGELKLVETTLAGGDHAVMSIEPAGAASAP
jgi:hypothetical protein